MEENKKTSVNINYEKLSSELKNCLGFIDEQGEQNESTSIDIITNGHSIESNYSFSPGINGVNILRDIERLTRKYLEEDLKKETVLEKYRKNGEKAPLELIDAILVRIASEISENVWTYLNRDALSEYSNASMYSINIHSSPYGDVHIKKTADSLKKKCYQNMMEIVERCCLINERPVIEKEEIEVYKTQNLPFGEEFVLEEWKSRKNGTVSFVEKKKNDGQSSGIPDMPDMKKIREKTFFEPHENQKNSLAYAIGRTVFDFWCKRENEEFDEEQFAQWYEHFKASIESNISPDESESDCFGKLLSIFANVLNSKTQGVAEVVFYRTLRQRLIWEYNKINNTAGDPTPQQQKEKQKIKSVGRYFSTLESFEQARITGLFESPNLNMGNKIFKSIRDSLPADMAKGEYRSCFVSSWDRWFSNAGNTYTMQGITLNPPVPDNACTVHGLQGKLGNHVSNTFSVKMNGYVPNLQDKPKNILAMMDKAFKENSKYKEKIMAEDDNGKKTPNLPSFDYHLFKTCAHIFDAMHKLEKIEKNPSSAFDFISFLAAAYAKFFHFYFLKSRCSNQTSEAKALSCEVLSSQFIKMVGEMTEVKKDSNSKYTGLKNILAGIGKYVMDDFRNFGKELPSGNDVSPATNTDAFSLVGMVHDFLTNDFILNLISEKLTFGESGLLADIDFVVDIARMCEQENDFSFPLINIDNAFNMEPFLDSRLNSSGDEQSEEKDKPGLVSRYIHVRFKNTDSSKNDSTSGTNQNRYCYIPAKLLFSVDDGYYKGDSMEMGMFVSPPKKNIFMVIGHNESSIDMLNVNNGKIPFMSGLNGTKLSYVSSFCSVLRQKVDKNQNSHMNRSPEAVFFTILYSCLSAMFFKQLSSFVKKTLGSDTTLAVGMARIHDDSDDDDNTSISSLCIAACSSIVSFIHGLDGCIALTQGIKIENIYNDKTKDYAEKACGFSFLSGFPQVVSLDSIPEDKRKYIAPLSQKIALTNINAITTDRYSDINKRQRNKVCGAMDFCSGALLVPEKGKIKVCEKRINLRSRIRHLGSDEYAFDLELFKNVVENRAREGAKTMALIVRVPSSGVHGAYALSDETYGMPTGNLLFMNPKYVNEMATITNQYNMTLVPIFSNDSVAMMTPLKDRTDSSCICVDGDIMLGKMKPDTPFNISIADYGQTAFGTFPLLMVNTIKPFKQKNGKKCLFSHGTLYSGMVDKLGLYNGNLLLEDTEIKKDIITALLTLHFTRNEKPSSKNVPLKQNALDIITSQKNEKTLHHRATVLMNLGQDFSNKTVSVFLPAFIWGMEKRTSELNQWQCPEPVFTIHDNDEDDAEETLFSYSDNEDSHEVKEKGNDE